LNTFCERRNFGPLLSAPTISRSNAKPFSPLRDASGQLSAIRMVWMPLMAFASKPCSVLVDVARITNLPGSPYAAV
jgi:hypothetical protein